MSETSNLHIIESTDPFDAELEASAVFDALDIAVRSEFLSGCEEFQTFLAEHYKYNLNCASEATIYSSSDMSLTNEWEEPHLLERGEGIIEGKDFCNHAYQHIVPSSFGGSLAS